jgi:RNA polymerase sigma-70 factor (ECF subfamily)
VDYNYAEQHFDAEELMEFVRQLPAVSQQVFNLFAIDGYSHKEISKMLGISTGTSKWHVSYARKTVIGMIEKKMKPEKKLAL